VTGVPPALSELPLSRLPAPEKEKRSRSFGEVAPHYGRYRPGPPASAVDWILPERVGTVVDLGAGTGALTRLLVGRAEHVVAIEPDDRMHSVLAEQVPGIRALMGRGESIPLPDGSVDALIASSSWHWMEPVATLSEVGRVLVPRGVLGALWSGPDPEGPFLAQARALLARERGPRDDPAQGVGASERPQGEFADLIMGDASRPSSTLEIPVGMPFEPPEHEVFRWDLALDADDLVGLLGTFSWIITMPDETRRGVIAEARRLLAELLGVEGDVTVDVAFRCEAWRSRRNP
jgi:SAM-dependent methyltransferase